MSRFECSVCSAPPDVLAAVNDALMKGESGRAIAARSAFSKSALYRHREKCLPKSIVSRHRARMVTAAIPGRVFVVWEGDEPPEDVGVNDVIINVRFEHFDVRDCKNPKALVNERLIDAARAEYLQKFPGAQFAEGETHATEELKLVGDENTSPAPIPAEESQVTTFENQGSPPTLKAEPVAATSECEHVMVRVSGDISRCQLCGYQTQPFQPIGPSRKWWDERHGTGRTRFGRFG